jgi:hypothetical protein
VPTGGQLQFYIGTLVGGISLAAGSIAGAITGADSLPLAGLGLVLGVLCALWGLARVQEYNRT